MGGCVKQGVKKNKNKKCSNIHMKSLQVSSHEGKYFRVKSAFNFAADLQDYP